MDNAENTEDSGSEFISEEQETASESAEDGEAAEQTAAEE